MSLTGVPDGRVGSAPFDSAGGCLEELTAEYELPVARMHHTAARPGSPHFICRAAPSQPPKNAPLNLSRYPGIDIKTGRGSVIVAPGSIINGRPYEVVSATELALPRYLFRGPARGPLASGPGMTVAPCRWDDLGVVSPGPRGAVGDADQRSDHRPAGRNARPCPGGRSA
ncbi:bifunctional DNA primase/polymerase [Streptomyces sp. I3(2020)]|nr:bifunctional DNA primase/polymerase [Streptomyces sp. I3(2020)]